MSPPGPVDAVLMVGFGGPTAPDEIRPFLRNVVAGRGVPDERLDEVEAHYRQLGGRSPYNDLTEKQRAALDRWLQQRGRRLPVHVGMRNWKPFLSDALGRMAEDGCRHAAGIILAAHRSPVSVEAYKQDVERAREQVGDGAPQVSYIEPWFDDPLFIEASASRLEELGLDRDGEWPEEVPVVFTAHSIPSAAAERSSYVADLQASCRGVAELLEIPRWELAYQSRSGDPRTPWLEPDICDVVARLGGEGVKEMAVQAIGFLCDHVEVLFDLDVEARQAAREAGLTLHRAGCVNDHPAFIELLGQRVVQAARQAG